MGAYVLMDLTPQGRMIADLHVYELGDVILLVLPLQVKDTVLARLDQFIFAEDVQLGDVTGTFGMVSLVGRESVRVPPLPPSVAVSCEAPRGVIEFVPPG